MRKSSMDKMREVKNAHQQQQTMSLNELLKLLVDPNRAPEKRRLNPTQEEFINDSHRIKAYMGPAGCAKTSTLCASGFIRALMQPGSKGLIARANYNKLKDTTGLRMEEMLRALPKGVLLDRDKTPPMKWWVQPIPMVVDGVTYDDPSQITFMGLTDGLGSYEFDWAILDEADELDESAVHEVNTRLRHKPKIFMALNIPVPYSLGLAFNPPDKHHWLYTACTGKDAQERTVNTPWMRHYRPQNRENLRNLDSSYYDVLTASLPEDARRRFVEGEWGSIFAGQPVYREFKQSIHVVDNLQYDSHAPMLRFWDFGYTHPACIWAQLSPEGHLFLLHEFLGQNLESKPFIERCKAITATRFPHASHFVDYGDPAITQRKDTGRTLNDFLSAGIQMVYRVSTIERGVTIIRNKLDLLIDGKPALQFARSGVPILIDAMRGGYILDKEGKKPVKDGYYDHEADAFRYGCFNLFDGSTPMNARTASRSWLRESMEYDASYDLVQNLPQNDEAN